VDNKTPLIEISKDEMQELQRDMRSARIHAWVNKNQQQLFVGLILLIVMIVGAGMYKEMLKKQQEAAATLFHQALDTQDVERKKDFFKTVIQDYSGTSYEAMSLILLASLDSEHSKDLLEQLIEHPKGSLEMSWQARLDLATIYLQENNIEKAKSVLKTQVGKEYAELRYFLLSQTTDDAAMKQTFLEKAQNAESHDEILRKQIETQLSQLKATT